MKKQKALHLGIYWFAYNQLFTEQNREQTTLLLFLH